MVCAAFFNISSSDGISDKACATCHGGSVDNNEGDLFLENIPNAYIPGMTYKLNLCLVDTKQIAAGFRLAVSQGYLKISGNDEMVKIVDKDATHSGITLLENDTACWKINWVAPLDLIENIKFVARAAAVNADFTENGDHGGYYHITSSSLKTVNYGPFYAKLENHTVHLTWSTIQEINSKKFIIEKSTNGQNWETLAEKSGFQKSTSLKKYRITDHNPTWGINYYRLSQIAFNGETNIHPEIIKVFIVNPDHLIKNQYTVGEKLNFGPNYVLLLLDVTGKTMGQTIAGQLLIPEIPEGIYFLKSEHSLSQVLITK
jgi:hypothetical protein